MGVGLNLDLVRNAHNKVKAEAHSRFEVEKALGALKEEHKELGNKLTVTERECSNALAGLKNAEAQAKDQRKLLYTTKIKLATQKQVVLDLKAELQKVKDVAKEVTRVAKETIEVVERGSYECGWRIQRLGWLRRLPKCAGIIALRPG